jgi:uncharacterized protein (TIGR02687 family)
MFKKIYDYSTEGISNLNNIVLFMNLWKDSVSNRASFLFFSDEYETNFINYSDIENFSVDKFGSHDYFRIFEKMIFLKLLKAVNDRNISVQNSVDIVKQRENSIWYQEFKVAYETLIFASKFIKTYDEINFDTLNSSEEFLNAYATSWFYCDLYYRKFMYSSSLITFPSNDLDELKQKIERLYSNQFLLTGNNKFQTILSRTSEWNFSGIKKQSQFYNQYVSDYREQNKKVAVIISDAFRYECGYEFATEINSQNRYMANLGFVASSLPSYTALGMASLLPNNSTSFVENNSENNKISVYVDGKDSSGLLNRKNILQTAVERSDAFKYDEYITKSVSELREITRNNDVIYIYHNKIDLDGDRRDSEANTFEACEKTILELKNLISKLASANFTQFVVTADHGFIYTEGAVHDSDFVENPFTADDVLMKKSRFVIGHNLTENNSFMNYKAEEVGVDGNFEIAIPKSINRLSISGSGNRFVHGGASLQEIVVPVIRIKKTRIDDVSKVDVDIIRVSSDVITTGQLNFSLYQNDVCNENVHGRTLKIGLYSEDSILLSDVYEKTFDSTSQNTNSREQSINLILSQKSNDYNNKSVFLRLEEKVENSSLYRVYKEKRFRINKTFETDF